MQISIGNNISIEISDRRISGNTPTGLLHQGQPFYLCILIYNTYSKIAGYKAI